MEGNSCNRKYDEEGIRRDYRHLTEYLIREKLTITTMESATAGQIASLITDTEGASEILQGAFVTYSNEAKIMQGVPKEILDEYSVYSKETAAAMAESCRNFYKTDIGIGVTGTMGNIDPMNKADSEVGVLYFAFATREYTRSYKTELPAMETRLQYKLAAAKEIYDMLVRDVLKIKVEPEGRV